MARIWMLVLAAICVFAAVALILLRLMPGPLRDADYLVIGSVSTLISLLALFIVIITTSSKAKNTFFKRRRKGS